MRTFFLILCTLLAATALAVIAVAMRYVVCGSPVQI